MFPDLAYVLTQRMGQQLEQLPRWFDKAVAHAAARRFDADSLLQARLAPDMFPLVRQIGSACDTAKLATARLTGRKAPVHADDQVSLELCRSRIAEVVAFVAETPREAFDGAADVKISFPWMPGKILRAEPYLLRHALPNFHFHFTTAYAILRHNGVDLGKVDYLGPLPFEEA